MKWAAVLVTAVLLQDPSTPTSTDLPVVKLTTHLVQVNVIVRDKQGRAITGLTKDDFTILDNGKSQVVRFFSMETNRVEPAPGSPLPPAVFTNRMEHRGEAPNAITAVLFDGLNTPIRDQLYARQQIMKFLRQLNPNDRVAIYALGSRLRVLHDFTNDVNSLLKSIGRQVRISNELGASAVDQPETYDRELDDFLRESSERLESYYTIRRVERTAQALETIAHHLAGRPGRKNLIWVSGGFPFMIGMDMRPLTVERRSFIHEIERATRAVSQANVAIYPVDARGLIGLFDVMPTMSAASPIYSQQTGINVNNQASQAVLQSQASMRELAARTGGIAFINTNDIAGAIRQAVDDSQLTYNLSFAPNHNQWDGKFREIKVRVKASGLEVRNRKGYVAFREQSPSDRKAGVAELTSAASSPLEATGLSLTVRKLASSPKLNLQVELDPREVGFQQRDGRWAAGLDVLVAMRDEKGDVLGSYSRTAGFNLKPETYDALLRSGISLAMQCDVAPRATRARVVVRDMASGQIGSVDVILN